MSDGTAWGWDNSFDVGGVTQGDDITTDMAQVESTLGLDDFVKCDVFGDNLQLLDSTGKHYSHGYACYGTSGIKRHGSYCKCAFGSPCSGDEIEPAAYPCSIYDWNDGDVLIDEVNQWSQIAVGGWSSQGIKTDGTLWGWGYNAYGMLGLGLMHPELGDNPDETCIRPLPEACDTNRTDWIKVDVGQIAGIAIDGEGYIWTWGLNSGGCLGHGYEQDYPDGYNEQGTPIRIDSVGGKFIDCETSEYNMAALTSDGELYFWGDSFYGTAAHVPGTLGCDDYDTSAPITWCEHWSPTKISGTHNFIAFSLGWYHILAIDQDNNVWASGMDECGCLGLGNEEELDYYSWQQIPNFKASYVDAGYSVSIAIGLDGKAYAWGCFGDLIYTPTQITFSDYWS